MKSSQPHWFLLLPLMLFCYELAGQEFSENGFHRYTTEEGLSNNHVTGIVQDSAGYVWITTASGINRFNGSRFVQFHSTSNRNSLPSEETVDVCWLDRERLAINASGLHIVNTRTGETRNIFIPYRDRQFEYKFNMLARTKGDEKGNIYILSRSGFYHYDKDYKLVHRFDFYSEKEVYTEHFFFGRDLLELDKRRLLIISIDGMYVYDKEKKIFERYRPQDSPLLAEFNDYPDVPYFFFQTRPGQFLVLKAESDTAVFVNTLTNEKVISNIPLNPIRSEIRWRSRLIRENDSVFYITGHYSGFYRILVRPNGTIQFGREKYFPGVVCHAIMRDNDNKVWIATNKGVFREDPARTQVQSFFLPGNMLDSFADLRIDDIHVTSDKVYAGTRGRGGLFVLDKKTLQLEKQVYFVKGNNNGNYIFAMAAADASNLIVGTDGPLFLYNFKTDAKKKITPPGWREAEDWTSDLTMDSRNNIWIAAHKIYKYNPLTHQFRIVPQHQRLLTVPVVIKEDHEGHMWMAGHGLARYNTRLDSFDLLLDSFPFIKMPDKQINSVVIDQNNTVWFNSNNNGLIAYEPSTKRFRHFTSGDGLPDNNIATMMVLGNKLWIACFSGVACMDLRTYQIVSFGKADGFPGMQVTKGAKFFYDAAEEMLYLGFSGAIVRFNPLLILRNRNSPRVFIESIVINGKKNEFLPGNLTIPWKDNEIMLTIGSINFADGQSQGFAYRVVSNNTPGWQNLGPVTSFSISNLSPGTHKIQVKVFSLNNRWPPQVKEISIVVLPPFWKEGWFITLLVLAIMAGVYLLVKWRTGITRKKEMQKTHIQKLIADDYKNLLELEQISNYFSSSLAEKKNEDEVLWDVASNLIGRMNYVDCMIYLWNDDKTKMIQKAAFGPKGKPEYISSQVFDVVPGQGIVGHVIETRQPILVNDTRKEPRYRVDEAFRLSEVCVPIIHNDELLGAIDSEHHLPGYFNERDVKILTTIATLIGNKLKQLESEKSLDQKQEELASINEQLVEARLAALQAQMNPHFVFNALNSIKRMILDGDNDKASRYLSKFALMIRMTLNHSSETFVSLEETIQYLRTYLDMEQLRFDDSFTYDITVAENIDAPETAIPSLMIQPLVENAIWHGLLPSAQDKKIHIRFILNHHKITCVIEDNGIGIRKSEKSKINNRPLHHSVGLENIQKRIKIMNEKFETDCSLEIIDLGETGKSDRGTRVMLRFNMVNI